MEYVKLGNSPLTVSRLCVGCMSFGDPASRMHAWTLDPAESEEIVKHALSLGINFFDTANTYSAGTSEEYLGRHPQQRPPRPGHPRLQGLLQRGAPLPGGHPARDRRHAAAAGHRLSGPVHHPPL